MKNVKCPYCNQDIVDNNGIWISGDYLCPNCYKNEKKWDNCNESIGGASSRR